jgi:hypothetical protein
MAPEQAPSLFQEFRMFSFRKGPAVRGVKLVSLSAALALAVFLAACGGDSGDSSSPTATTAAGSATGETTRSATSSTPSSNPTAAGTATSGNVSRLADLDSYRYTLVMEGRGGPLAGLADAFDESADPNADVTMEVSGVYVKPDKGQVTITIGGLEIGITTIGTQQWTSFSGVTSGPQQIPAPSAGDLSFAASFWDEGFLTSAENFDCTGSTETVNGVQTRKCSIDAETFEQLRQLGGIFSAEESDIEDLDRFVFELWLTASGHPVRLITEMEGTDTSGDDFVLRVNMNITEINSSSLQVRAP